jgi:hypothetical protein
MAESAALLVAVTLIQCFGGALNLNIHFHLLVLDGVYVRATDTPVFRHVKAPTREDLKILLKAIAVATADSLERHGWLTRDAENTYLTRGPTDALESLMAHGITYRIAVGPHRGDKAFTLQTVPGAPDTADPELTGKAATYAGFSLHAGTAAPAHQRDRLARLCRYITRPPVATERLSLTPQGLIRYAMKTPWKNGTTHLLFEPLDFIARLTALVPKPRVNLIRYHGCFAPHSALPAQVTPERRHAPNPCADSTPTPQAAAARRPPPVRRQAEGTARLDVGVRPSSRPRQPSQPAWPLPQHPLSSRHRPQAPRRTPEFRSNTVSTTVPYRRQRRLC